MIRTVVGVALAVASAACAGSDASSPTVPGGTTGTAATAGRAVTSAPGANAGSAPASGSAGSVAGMPSTGAPTTDAPSTVAMLCAGVGAETAGVIAAVELVETSGLAASRAHPGVLWAHNDGGDRPGVFAVGDTGTDLGFHPIEGIDAVDIEDIAVVGPPGAADILLADIGDNGEVRDSIAVVRFPEPDLGVSAPVADVEVLTFRYPDRPHDAETLLVDEAGERIVIVTKEQETTEPAASSGRAGTGRTEPSLVFEGSLEGHGDGAVELVAAGTIDTLALEARRTGPVHPASILGFGGVPTGGDVSPDGSAIVIRTYEAVWAWARSPGQSVTAALQGEPCEVPWVVEAQGEAIAVAGDGLVTVSEGPGRPLHRRSG